MNNYKNIKVFNKTYNNIEEIQDFLIKSQGINLSKCSILNHIVQTYRESLIKNINKKNVSNN